MAVGLVIPSFVCAVFLAIFIPVQRIRTSVPRLSIILWLFGYNIVHGINALVWSGNVGLHIPVWCDIVTNLMLGANLALPAAFLCISRQLELLSSTRDISSHPTVVRNHLILDIFICYVLPVLYMFLHLLVQDHRFDLVENFGCSASVDPSAVGFSIMWIPPLLTCIISILFFVLSIRNSSRHGSSLTIHLESRSTMDYSSFFRCLVIFMVMTIVSSLFSLFCWFSGPAFHPWSWTAVHASMSEIDIISSKDDIVPIQLAWWGGFVVSVIYLLLSYSLGEETRDIFRWIKKQATHERHFVLPIHISKKASLSLPKNNRPLTVELKSGWDDMLDIKIPKAKKNAGKASTTTISTTCSSPTPTLSTVATGDEAFMASTFSYLDSPPAKMLGLSGWPVSPDTFELPPKPIIPPPLPPTDPPASPLPGLPASSSRSATYSEKRFCHPTFSRPFEGSSVSLRHDNFSGTESPTGSPTKSKRLSIRMLQRSWSQERHAALSEAIHMTVVKETV